MDVILLTKVANLGTIGDRVKVKSGYGRNFLLPGGKATLATPDNVARFELLDVLGRGQRGLALRQKEVATVTRLHLDAIADGAEVGHFR